MKEAVHFLSVFRSLKFNHIHSKLQEYSKPPQSALTLLGEVGSRSFNQFSKVYQL
jgi:hypothetical protein